MEWGDEYLDVHRVCDSLQLCFACRNDAALAILSGVQRRLDLEPRRALDIEMPSNYDGFAIYVRIDGVGTFVLDTYSHFASTAVKPKS